MRIADRVYGSVDVTEPLLVQLIESPALQRLKGISIAGYTAAHRPRSTVSRFEHSVGVMLGLRRFGAPLEEQAAGLIHDVSHGVFSHTLDYVLADAGADQSHQDSIQDSFVRDRTDIPAIAERHGIRLADLLDDTRHPLKEQSLPDLCADRLDYTLRDGLDLGVFMPDEAQRALDGLHVVNTSWAFADATTARLFAERFWALNRDWYASFATAAMFLSTAGYLKRALAARFVTVDDLYTTDAVVLEKINVHLSEDEELARRWHEMNTADGWKNDPSRPEAKIVCKSRMVDPLVKHEGNIVRLSVVQPEWGEIVKAESKPKEWYPVYAK